jgi:AcrR family transcriptional regulator
MTTSNGLTKGDRTRQLIIDAAHDLFVEQGYAASSMRQIAERSGLALGGIYNHFSGKEAIFSAVIVEKHPFHQVLPALQAEPGSSFEDFIRKAARNLVAEMGRRPDFVKLMFVELVEFEGKNLPVIYEAVFPQMLPLVERFGTIKGELREIEPFVLFRSFLGLFFSFYMTELMFSNLPIAMTSQNTLDAFVDIYLFGVMASRQPSQDSGLEA